MAKIKVFFDEKGLAGGHSTRGIGYYTANLLAELKKSNKIKLVGNSNEAEIVHLPYFDLFFDTLRIGKESVVVTVYDTTPLIYPEHYPPGIRGQINFLKQKRKLRKASAIITISETSKKDIVRFLDVPQEKIYPIHLAPSSIFKKLETGNWKLETGKRYVLPERFVLYVGDVNYNKNLLNLARAARHVGIPLVIVGKQAGEGNVDFTHPENKPFGKFLSEYGGDKDIIRLGYVETEDLVRIYNLATVYCQPSFYEGFGLPVLEAMACGTPVLAAKTQALVEIAEGAAYFTKSDAGSLAKGLSEVISDKNLQKKLSAQGLEHAKNFSWEETAEETIKVYETNFQK